MKYLFNILIFIFIVILSCENIRLHKKVTALQTIVNDIKLDQKSYDYTFDRITLDMFIIKVASGVSLTRKEIIQVIDIYNDDLKRMLEENDN